MKIHNQQERKVILECSIQEIRTVLSGLRQACAASRKVEAPDRDPLPCQLYWALADFYEESIDPNVQYPQDRIELLRTLDRVWQNPGRLALKVKEKNMEETQNGMINGDGRRVILQTATCGDAEEPNANREEANLVIDYNNTSNSSEPCAICG